VIPTNVGQLFKTKNDPLKQLSRHFPRFITMVLNSKEPIKFNICKHDLKNFNLKNKNKTPKNQHNKEGLKLMFGQIFDFITNI
jgi:hypothetical protein